jgi:predicted nucleic acid-binding protein
LLVHLDTSVHIDPFTGPRRSLPQVVSATSAGHVLSYSALVAYEWLRGPRVESETRAIQRFFGDQPVEAFGRLEAETAASLYRRAARARLRQADLAIAACAIEHGAQLWTLNERDFVDVPGLMLYRPGPMTLE